MKIIAAIFKNDRIEAAGLLLGIIALAIIFVVIAIFLGAITYWLLSVAFPEYLTFGWHWWRFIAIGVIEMIVA